MNRPDLTGGLEEAWRSVSAIPLLDLHAVLNYVRIRNRATLAAKVGLFLERHRDHFAVPVPVLEELQSLRPRAPYYLDRPARGKLVAPWNLIVPTSCLKADRRPFSDRGARIRRLAAESRYREEIVEKVLYLETIVPQLARHPDLEAMQAARATFGAAVARAIGLTPRLTEASIKRPTRVTRLTGVMERVIVRRND